MARASFCLLVVLGLLTGCGDSGQNRAGTTATGSHVVSGQALRTCVDRWNQDNMLGWGPALVSVAVRRPSANEQGHIGVYDRRRRCTVSLAMSYPRDSQTGCSGDAVMPGYPRRCVSTEQTDVCAINKVGGYECSFYSDGDPPLRNKNATTDRRGVLRLDVPLTGTHAIPPLAWQRRYPHIDGFIHPWTSSGRLRPGLSFDKAGGRRYRGHCWRGSELAHDPSALRCYSDGGFDPCFASPKGWTRPGVIVACAGAGWTSFARFVVTRRS